jgi:hypothetical protein
VIKKYQTLLRDYFFPKNIFAIANTRVSDILILIKPFVCIGINTIAFKGNVVDPKNLPSAVENMKK